MIFFPVQCTAFVRPDVSHDKQRNRPRLNDHQQDALQFDQLWLERLRVRRLTWAPTTCRKCRPPWPRSAWDWSETQKPARESAPAGHSLPAHLESGGHGESAATHMALKSKTLKYVVFFWASCGLELFLRQQYKEDAAIEELLLLHFHT